MNIRIICYSNNVYLLFVLLYCLQIMMSDMRTMKHRWLWYMEGLSTYYSELDI
jgi:hypothetical protein